MALDGVYAAGEEGRPEFHQLPAPEDEDVLRLTTLVSERVQSLLERRGCGTEADSQQADPLLQDDPAMAALLANSVRRRIAVSSNTGRGVVRLGDQIDGDGLDAFQSPRCAMVSGFNVHANVFIEARDRLRLERLCRYAGRPAVATERLTTLPDGRLLYRLKRPWRDGTSAVIFERLDFIAKLAVLVPAPRVHLTRYHGVLGPAAAWRPLIIPTTNETASEISLSPAPSPQPSTMPAVDGEPAPHALPSARYRNHTWSELMKRVFRVTTQRDTCVSAKRNIALNPPPVRKSCLESAARPACGPAAARRFT